MTGTYDFTDESLTASEFEVVTDPGEIILMPSATDAGEYEISEPGEFISESYINDNDEIYSSEVYINDEINGDNHIIIDDAPVIINDEYDNITATSTPIIIDDILVSEEPEIENHLVIDDNNNSSDSGNLNELKALASIRDAVKSGTDENTDYYETVVVQLQEINIKVQYTNILLATIIGILFIYLLLSKIHI